MKTIADLKRDLSVGKQMTLTGSNREHKKLNIPRYVVKTNTQGIWLAEEKDAVKGSFLDYPRASLASYDGVTLTIHAPAWRALTAEEQRALDTLPSAQPENKERVIQEAMTDGSGFYYKDKAHFKSLGMEHMSGHETVRGLRYDWNRKMVEDESLKGEMELEYTITK